MVGGHDYSEVLQIRNGLEHFVSILRIRKECRFNRLICWSDLGTILTQWDFLHPAEAGNSSVHIYCVGLSAFGLNVTLNEINPQLFSVRPQWNYIFKYNREMFFVSARALLYWLLFINAEFSSVRTERRTLKFWAGLSYRGDGKFLSCPNMRFSHS